MAKELVVSSIEELRIWRRNQGLTKAQAAERCGVPTAVYSRAELGQAVPRPYHALAIAKMVGTEPVLIWPEEQKAAA